VAKPVVVFGPEMPGWGSWSWVGADLAEELSDRFETRSFRGDTVPDCDVTVIVKHPLETEKLREIAARAAVIYCPLDFCGRGRCC
jgi:hypothetical protein